MTTTPDTTSADQLPAAVQQTRRRLGEVLADLERVAAGVGPQHADLPTPCREYDVAALTGHVVGWLENFAAGLASADGTCPRSDVGEVTVAADEASARIRAGARTIDEAVRRGATGRPLVIAAQGGMPGELALSMMLGEYLVHGWDLARATGQQWDPPAETADAAREFLAGMVAPEHRGAGGMFGPEVAVPEDAPALDRLIGFSGRDPRWTSPAG